MVLTLIVTFNGEEYIEDCIDSIQRQSYKTDILVVDNGSADHTCELIEKEYPNVKLIKLGDNYGFAGANNIGMRYAMEHEYEYLLLLNEDTIAERFLLQRMLEYADHSTAVIPKIYYKVGSLRKIWYAAGQLDFGKGRVVMCREELMDKVTEVTFMTGCCILIPVDVLKEIGLFDENYFMYYEDTDLSLRMYKHQIKMLYIPYTYVWHRLQGRRTKPYCIYYMTRNRLYFLKKHSEILRQNICKAVIDETVRIILGRDSYSKAFRWCYLKGVWDFVRGRKGALTGSLHESNRMSHKSYQQVEKYQIFNDLICEWVKGDAEGTKITDWIEKREYRTVAIYGMGLLGETVYLSLQKCENIQIKYGLDKRNNVQIEGLNIYHIENCPEPVDLIIVTAVTAYEEIKDEIQNKLKFNCKVVSLARLIEEMYIISETN